MNSVGRPVPVAAASPVPTLAGAGAKQRHQAKPRKSKKKPAYSHAGSLLAWLRKAVSDPSISGDDVRAVIKASQSKGAELPDEAQGVIAEILEMKP